MVLRDKELATEHIKYTENRVQSVSVPLLRVFKGKKMPGRMGAQKTTIMNLQVVKVDSESEILLIKGSVPGPKGATVVVRNATKVPVSTGDAQ